MSEYKFLRTLHPLPEGFVHIKNHNRYGVNKEGVVWGRIHKKPLSKVILWGGYVYVTLQRDDKNARHRVSLSHIIAEAFIDNPDPEHFHLVDHIDGKPLNNNVDNLRWCNYIGNNANMRKSGIKNGKPTTSKYKGVCRVCSGKEKYKWRFLFVIKL